MVSSYAVSWQDASGARGSGSLRLGDHALCFTGAERREIPYERLVAVSLGRGTGEKLGTRTTVVLALSDGSSLLVAPVAERAALLELVERLTALAALTPS
jgi:hypothetical protein